MIYNLQLLDEYGQIAVDIHATPKGLKESIKEGRELLKVTDWECISKEMRANKHEGEEVPGDPVKLDVHKDWAQVCCWSFGSSIEFDDMPDDCDDIYWDDEGYWRGGNEDRTCYWDAKTKTWEVLPGDITELLFPETNEQDPIAIDDGSNLTGV